MKIAISSDEKKINGNIAENFGRCTYFLFVEIAKGEIKELEVVENKSQNQASGVGIAVAQMIAEKNVNAIIAGAVGPRALEVLKQFNIQVYQTSGPIKKAIEKFIK